MPISCGYCGATMPDISEFCPSCGRPVREGNVFAPEEASIEEDARETPSAPPLPAVDWNDRWIGALAYLTFIPAVLFLFLKQFQQRKFVRFHAFQSVLFWAAVVVFALLGVLASMFGWLFMWMLAGTLIGMALFFTWLLLSIKALQGEWFGLPWLGSFAQQHAGK
jgi:uncharacterized membrane protein